MDTDYKLIVFLPLKMKQIYIYIYIYISCILNHWPENLNTGFKLGNLLFGSVKLRKNADQINTYIVVMIFDSRSEFSLSDGSMEKNVIIYRTNLSLPAYIDIKGKDISFLMKGQHKD